VGSPTRSGAHSSSWTALHRCNFSESSGYRTSSTPHSSTLLLLVDWRTSTPARLRTEWRLEGRGTDGAEVQIAGRVIN
jgi:hypothetical protein